MKDIFVILRTSRRGCDTQTEAYPVAYGSRQAALDAIIEEVETMLRNGDDPGPGARTDPEIIEDPENSSHNRGALKFRDPDAEGCLRIDIWDPATCPEGSEDVPAFSEWWESFEIYSIYLSEVDEAHAGPTRTQFLSAEQVRLGDILDAAGHTDPSHALRLPEPFAIRQSLDTNRDYSESGDFLVEALWVIRGQPFVSGHWAKCGHQDAFGVHNTSWQYRGEYEEARWDIGGLDGIAETLCHKNG